MPNPTGWPQIAKRVDQTKDDTEGDQCCLEKFFLAVSVHTLPPEIPVMPCQTVELTRLVYSIRSQLPSTIVRRAPGRCAVRYESIPLTIHLHVLHCEIGAPLMRVDRKHLDDVRVIEIRNRARLAQESRDE